jgi:hypothetical protein
MKIRLILCLPLLAATALTSGCVTSKTPVGDKVAALKPEIWNAKWLDADGEIVRSKITNEKLGIVRMTLQPSLLKPRETHEELVRMLGPLTIANQKTDGGYQFGRVAIDHNHLVVFNPNDSLFLSLIKHHEIAGKVDRDAHGKPTGSATIQGLSYKDCQRLKKEGFDTRSLFDDDPSTVLIRYRWIPFW